MNPSEHRIVAHHIGGRGFGVALNCPAGLSDGILHILYEADRVCAQDMIDKNPHDNLRIFPYCVGARDETAKFFITKNPYASSNFEPNPEYDVYYCEVALSGAIDGVSVQDARYDAVYGNENKVVETRDVDVRTLDDIFAKGEIPAGQYPDFLSLDTQGSELNILKGAEGVFHDHCMALATEVEFHRMYSAQPLFSDIFDFALGHGFHFVGFTYLQEFSSHRLPLGARAKGFLGFGDALFLRRIDSVLALPISNNERYLKLLKLAFISLNFGYLEYSIQVLAAADQVGPDNDFRERLLQLACFRMLYDLKMAVGELPQVVLHFDRASLVDELRRVRRDRPRPVKGQPQRIRHLIFSNPVLAFLTLCQHFFPRLYPQKGAPSIKFIEAVKSLRPAGASVETVLAHYGYVWWADMVRQRREAAESYVPGRM